MALGAGWLFDFLEVQLFGSAVGPLGEHFHASVFAQDAILAVWLTGILLGALAGGWLADRYGRRRLFVLTLLWYAAFTVLTGLSPALGFVYGFRFLAALGVGAEYAIVNASIAELMPARVRGRVGAVVMNFWPAGAVLAGLLAYLLLNMLALDDAVSWRYLFVLGGLLALAVLETPLMRIAVCGGPYANPYALKAFVDDARTRGAERLYCLGDLGGFGADIDALWPILTGNDITCVAGNYDVAIARGDTDCGCGYRDPKDNEYAQIVYDHTLATTSRTFAAWMGRLPTERRETIDNVDVHMVHGSTLALNDFWWESLPEDQHRLRARASGADVVLCTHSGLPWQRRLDDTLVVNVGVLGKPANDGRRNVWYALLDLDDGQATAELVPLAYDWRAQAASMRAAGLPEVFVETIETGWWTTCLEVLPPTERSRGRYHLYHSTLPTGFRPADDGWGTGAAPDLHGDRPVVPLFGTPYFPSRLWLYTNFHCNLACDYCAVASSPGAAPRTLPAATFRTLVDEAVDAGFTELYVTGGEPFLHPDIVDLLDHAGSRLPTVVMTNAMLLRGRRAHGLADLADRKLTVQTSLDGATAATHDAHRGTGSWQRTMDGIRHLIDLGLPPRIALTETPENTAEIPAATALLAGLGLPSDHFAVRPMLRRGLSGTGIEIDEETSIPELTVTADGLHWHPAGADLTTSPDMHLAPAGTPLEAGKQRVTERFFAARLTDGSLPRPVHCAI